MKSEWASPDGRAGGLAPAPGSEVPSDSTTHAYERVRAAILDGTLPAGHVFSQVQLAARLGISRTPLREALRLLQTERLVRADFNRRVEVAPLTLPDMEDVYAMRIALEPLGVRLTVPSLSRLDVDALASDHQAMIRAGERRDADGVRAPHRRFHFALFASAGERLGRQIGDLWDQAERYRRLYQDSETTGLGLLELARQEHAAMIDLARAGDAIGASRVVAEHLARTAITVMARVDGAHEPLMVREALRVAIHGTAAR